MIEYKVEVYENRTEWRNQNDELHRLDGPALVYADGAKFWYVGGKLHRLDGPAVEMNNGTKSWYADGKRHRLDGPAIEYSDGDREWWIDGVEYSEEEFQQKVEEMKSPCEGKIVEVDGKKYKLTEV